jgi:hypothetical protein
MSSYTKSSSTSIERKKSSSKKVKDMSSSDTDISNKSTIKNNDRSSFSKIKNKGPDTKKKSKNTNSTDSKKKSKKKSQGPDTKKKSKDTSSTDSDTKKKSKKKSQGPDIKKKSKDTSSDTKKKSKIKKKSKDTSSDSDTNKKVSSDSDTNNKISYTSKAVSIKRENNSSSDSSQEETKPQPKKENKNKFFKLLPLNTPTISNKINTTNNSNKVNINKVSTISKSTNKVDTQTRLSFRNTIKEVSPKFILKSVQDPNGTNFTVIDESSLFGGSKQRALMGLFPNIRQSELVYAGPSTGYAQVAIAYCCLLAGKIAKIFSDAEEDESRPLIEIASHLGAQYVYFNSKIKEKRLQYSQEQATSYCSKNSKTAYLLPFGLNDNTIKELYYNAFTPLKEYNPLRVWVASGSGTLFSVISRVWPEAEIMIVQVGKKIWPDQLQNIKHQLFISQYHFNEDIKEKPPYNTLLSYDGKIWPFVLKYGKEGDFIWNTAGAPVSIATIDTEVKRIKKLLIQSLEEENKVKTRVAFPYFYEHMPPPEEMFNTLQKEMKEISGTRIIRNFTTDYTRVEGISNHFTEKVRMDCIVNIGEALSPHQYWEKYKDKIAAEAYWLGSIEQPAWREAMVNLRYNECNTFNPLLIMCIIKRYFTKKVKMLDPSMGWGDRLIGALAMKCKRYVGFDPNIRLEACYKKIISTLENNTKTTFIMKRYSNAELDSKMVGSFDLAVTSPPYYNKELYSGTEKDVQKSYTSWIKDMYTPFLRDMALAVREEGIVAIHIENIPRIGMMADDTNRILKEQQLEFIETIDFQNNTTEVNGLLKLGSVRSMFVYRKKASKVIVHT